MVLFCVGLALDQFRCYSREVEGIQRSAALNLLQALHHEDDGLGRKLQQTALQQFLWILFTQDKRELSRYTLTVYRFLLLYSFRRQGCLAKSGTVTQYISRIVFFGRATIFNKIKACMVKKKQGHFTYVIRLVVIDKTSPFHW